MSTLTDKEVGEARTAHIISDLFENHPRQRNFNALDVSVKTEADPGDEPDILFDDLMKWLKDNGYVRFDQDMEGSAFDVSLTEKGYAVLGSKPPGLDKPLSVKFKEALKLSVNEGRRAALGKLSGALAEAIVFYFKTPTAN